MLSLVASLVLATAPCAAPSVNDSLRVPILVYHNVQPAAAARGVRGAELTMRPEVFAEQMQYLEDQHITVISLGALVDALEEKCAVPERSVVITFDDGRVNQYEFAFPVLKKHGYTATFFPFTHAMNRNPRYFTWNQLREMQHAGMTIGSHTHLHVRVDKVRDPKVMHDEITGSRQILRKQLASPTDFFAYPFGAMSPSGDSAVKAAGYRAARSFGGGVWNSARDLPRLRAIPVTENMAHFRSVVNPGMKRQSTPQPVESTPGAARGRRAVTSRSPASSG